MYKRYINLLPVRTRSTDVRLLYSFASLYFLNHFYYFRGAIGRKEDVHRLSDDFASRIPIDAFRTAVPVGDNPAQRLTDDRVIRTLYHGRQAGLIIFTLLAVRNITPDGRSAHNSFHGVPDGRRSDFNMEYFSSFSYAQGLEVIDDFTAFQSFQYLGNLICATQGNEHAHRLPDSLSRGVPIDPLRTDVPTGDDSFKR